MANGPITPPSGRTHQGNIVCIFGLTVYPYLPDIRPPGVHEINNRPFDSILLFIGKILPQMNNDYIFIRADRPFCFSESRHYLLMDSMTCANSSSGILSNGMLGLDSVSILPVSSWI